ncbi:MAG TPA: hypothetical protein VLB74_03085 [Flavobacterium sp.]|uniref:hypothetical protein n=1 Tax=Flavobacterium sp. TaxID=239 RepID=UPI002B55FDB2|nr:hypothetical protein [Flavobacterium sp.]HSD13613.1 hypothetical protein [Flavobacterium sp.]
MNIGFNKGLPWLFSLLFTHASFSQNEAEFKTKAEKKIEIGFEGMIGLSFGDKIIGINVGGPSLKYKCNKNIKIGVGAFPSLVVFDEKAYPKLGVSPILDYKQWMFIVPYYGYDILDRMIWTYGLGYKF